MTRVGNFSSSAIYRLCGSNTVFETYVRNKRRERRLGNAIEKRHNAKPTRWGELCEPIAVSKLPKEDGYHYVSHLRLFHSEIACWCGVPDLVNDLFVGDIKCPWSYTSFCQYVDYIEAGDLEKFKKNQKEVYWQLVSNGILADKRKAELIVYMPTLADLDLVHKAADGVPEYSFVQWASSNDELPYLPENSKYKSMYRYQFDIPQDDIEFLTERVRLAESKLLAA